MINPFNFPRVTVQQIFTNVAEGATSKLPTCVVGQYFNVRKYSRNGQQLLVTYTISGGVESHVLPTTQVQITIPALGSDVCDVTNANQTVFIKNARIKFSDAPAAKPLTGSIGTPASIITIKQENATVSVAGATRCTNILLDVQGGDYISITGTKDDGATAVSQLIQILQLTSDNTAVVLASATTATAITQVVFIRQQDVTVKGSAVATTPADPKTQFKFNGLDVPYVYNNQTCTVLAGYGKCYLQYRTICKDYSAAPEHVIGGQYAQQACLQLFGDCSADNPLGQAVLAAAKACGTYYVYFLSVPADSKEAYQNALDILQKDDTTYSIVLCTTKKEAIVRCLQLINSSAEQAVPRYKILWYSIQLPTPSVTTQQLIDCGITHTYAQLTNDDLVKWIIGHKYTADRRAAAVFADGLYFAGEASPNYVAAAAAAAMRSYQAPHRPLSNMSYSHITVTDKHGFTASQLRTLGANGIWLIGNNQNGVPINRRQLTTAAANDINYDEQSLTTNVDSICLALKHIGQDQVGNSNISDALISLLYDNVTIAMDGFKDTSYGIQVGPQLLDYTIVQLAQDPVSLDHVYAVIKGQPPKPFNEFNITFNMI